LQTLKNID